MDISMLVTVFVGNVELRSSLASVSHVLLLSAGRGGVMGGTSSDASHGRFQAALLGLGSMHAHLGHVSQGLQVRIFSSQLDG